VRSVLAWRRERDRYFEAGLFADPAWDILLELYAAELGQRRMAVSSLCIGAAVPATTALRWIRLLEKKGLVVRSADPFDGRRVFVALAEDAVKAMDRFFAKVPARAPVV
jgi:DNA-binding MarR family transcriptional regulator